MTRRQWLLASMRAQEASQEAREVNLSQPTINHREVTVNHSAIHLQSLDANDERGTRAKKAYQRSCERFGYLYQEPGGNGLDLWKLAGKVFISVGTSSVCRLDSQDRATCIPDEEVPEALRKAIRKLWNA